MSGTVTIRKPPDAEGPTIESIHRDITFANSYRLELLKYLLAIAAALFAFTVAFRPTLSPVASPWAMWLGWAGLAVSMVGGILHMMGWDHYYKSYRDCDWRYRETDGRERGRRKRKEINLWRRSAMVSQYVGFAIGVIGIGIFAGVNVDNVRKADDPARAATSVNAARPDAQQSLGGATK
jgi:hypothetical protein